MKRSLNDYIALLEERDLLSAPVPEELDRTAPVELVSYDSREVVPGTLFLCKGAHFKAEFLQMAQDKGAIAYVSERPYPESPLPCLQVDDMRSTIAPLADLFFGHPSGRLKVIGLTGTKGKSSTAYYLKHILDSFLAAQGRPECGIVSSIDTYDGVERFESHITTPDALDLQRHFARAAEAGLDYLVMEVSSQALKYHRSLCTDFAAAAFLNIGYDHISPIEHTDFQDYFSSKLRIFAQGAVNCVDLDCDRAGQVLEAAKAAGRPVIAFSQKDPAADVYASQVRKRGDDILFQVRTCRYDREFRLTMPGLFNVENALAAIAVCEALDIPPQHIYAGLERARVPGRMEVYANSDGSVTAIVDYAHNRMSFETLFRSVRAEYPGRRIVTVFGCPGLKALDRRRDLGEISGRWSDLVVLTEEDSGEEDTVSICREIAGHVAGQGCPYLIEPNRGEAIRQAVLSCREPSVLLITGKGRETRQKRGREYVEVPTDVDYVQSFLGELDSLRGLDGMGRVRGLLSLLPALKKHRGKKAAVRSSFQREDLLQDMDALETVGIEAVLVRPGEEIPRDADYLVYLTELEDGGVLERMDVQRAEELLSSDGLPEGLASLAADCLTALRTGTEEAAVLDGRREHALLLYLLDQPIPGLIVTAAQG